MADYLKPTPARPRTRRGYALGVTLAGALLVFCAILPWAGLEARSSLVGFGVADDLRGIDDAFGIYTLVAGLAALACGLAGVLGRTWLAALAVVPGGVALAALVVFMTSRGGVRDRISVDLGKVLSIEPVIRLGWFAALACSIAIVVLALLALFRRA
ncbi:hypothetical protein ITP53_42650 [Nonomuraea sp. K274]|uniref:Uncharacterized protein n=1 Tax=Nonomuraea cypriaca TaxID=1187855 RepID=A0A931AKM3_9ACTN|nr:hypothetical protein [Nonomuraea cypriaca]